MSAGESITSLSEAVAEYGAMPMPAGPAPQRACPLCGVVKPDVAAMRDHVRNVHPDEFCGLYHEQPCRHAAVMSLREPEGEHYATVHHDYRLGHDLPEMGGTQ